MDTHDCELWGQASNYISVSVYVLHLPYYYLLNLWYVSTLFWGSLLHIHSVKPWKNGWSAVFFTHLLRSGFEFWSVYLDFLHVKTTNLSASFDYLMGSWQNNYPHCIISFLNSKQQMTKSPKLVLYICETLQRHEKCFFFFNANKSVD